MVRLDGLPALTSAWKNLTWPPVRLEAAKRVFNPSLIDQATTGTCGFAAALFSEARSASAYINSVIDVFSTGKYESFDVPLKVRGRPPIPRMAKVDWLMLTASQNKHNSESGAKAYLGTPLTKGSPQGGTPDFSNFGAQTRTDVAVTAVDQAVTESKKAFANGPENVFVTLTNRAFYLDRTGNEADINHDVALTGPIFVDDKVNVPLYTWGSRRTLRLSAKDFLRFAVTLHIANRR